MPVSALATRAGRRSRGAIARCFEARPLMTLTLTCDHRSLDGARAADFLRTVKAFLEEPGLML